MTRFFDKNVYETMKHTDRGYHPSLYNFKNRKHGLYNFYPQRHSSEITRTWHLEIRTYLLTNRLLQYVFGFNPNAASRLSLYYLIFSLFFIASLFIIFDVLFIVIIIIVTIIVLFKFLIVSIGLRSFPFHGR